MTQANALNYSLAADLVAEGSWRVDTSLGLVYGKRGNPFRRTNSDGYIQIKFRDPNDWRVEHAALAHRVVWESVHGPMPTDLTVNHLNGNKRDNRLANLEAITHADNVRHAFATGLNVRPVLTECKRSHAFTEENTRVLATRGTRVCRECDRMRAKAYRKRRSDVA